MGLRDARRTLLRARRDQLAAVVLIAGASGRVRLAQGRIRLHKRLRRWRRQWRLPLGRS